MTKGEDAGMKYGYLLDVLSWTRNKKYAKKEVKKGLRVVQVQITNDTEEPILVREDVRVFIGGEEVRMVEIPMAVEALKQRWLLYLLYIGLIPSITICNGTNCETTPIPIGLGIAALNIALASNANKSFERDLMYQNIRDRVIEPGETTTGLICFFSVSMGHMSMKLDK
jgi:hypothetical protein